MNGPFKEAYSSEIRRNISKKRIEISSETHFTGENLCTQKLIKRKDFVDQMRELSQRIPLI